MMSTNWRQRLLWQTPIDWSDSIAWRTGAEDRVIGSILQKLKEAKRPLILAGGGSTTPLPRNSCGYLRRR